MAFTIDWSIITTSTSTEDLYVMTPPHPMNEEPGLPISYRIGQWLAILLSDPTTPDEMKADIDEWLEADSPGFSSTLPPSDKLRVAAKDIFDAIVDRDDVPLELVLALEAALGEEEE